MAGPQEPADASWAVGAVLCGGASRRMGVDKATLVVGGLPMAARVARALHQVGVAEVLVVGGGQPVEEALADEAVRVVPDDRPGEGPLAAVATALRQGHGRSVLAVACDLVAPAPDAMAACLAALASSGADVAVPLVGDRPQWAHAAWSPRALAPLDRALAAGERALHRAAAGLRVWDVPGLDPRALADADEPGELSR